MIKLMPVVLLAGCASTTPCYFQVGVGAWVTQDVAPDGVPSEANLYCEYHNWEAGLYHTSDITRGRPFNNQEEISTDKIMIKYKVPLR